MSAPATAPFIAAQAWDKRFKGDCSQMRTWVSHDVTGALRCIVCGEISLPVPR